MKIFIIYVLLFIVYITFLSSDAYAHGIVGYDYKISDNDCVKYERYVNVYKPNVYNEFIFVCGGDLNIKELDVLLNNRTLLYEESDGVWVLNGTLSIASDVTVRLTSDDMKWLKIIDNKKQNHIEVMGKLIIEGINVTSWDTNTNYYSILKSPREGRPHILVINGLIEIRDSFIGYLGYDSARSHGLSIYGGTNHILINSTITNNYFGLYTDNVNGMIIDNNMVYNNYVYGLDPHTFSRDIIITNNEVYNNGKHGIICSRDCYNIQIVNNTVYNNKGHGIMLDRDTYNSLIKSNIIINNDNGIKLFASYNNTIVDNKIVDNKDGIRLSTNSYSNYINGNTIKSSSYGIYILDATHDIIIENNTIDDSKIDFYIKDSNNIITNNNIIDKHFSMQLYNSTMETSDNQYTCPCTIHLYNSDLKHKDDNILNITYSIIESSIEVYDSHKRIYTNTMNLPIRISNSSNLIIAADKGKVGINREDIIIHANNTIDLVYDKELNLIKIMNDKSTIISVENIDNNYYITDYVQKIDSTFTIKGDTTIYLNPIKDSSIINRLLESRYLILLILTLFGILSAVIIVKKR
ncbi:MAG: right-handed parallel beta-helix repeat-containing protein [Candidatus Nitrosocaldaceae archaeon]